VRGPGTRYGVRALAAGLAALALLWPLGGSAEVLVEADRAQQGLAETVAVGATEVPGLGRVRVEARADGTALGLWVRDGAGTLVGEGHTVTGLAESEVFVRTPSGLERVRIRWPRPAN
jgi:hypothetical protein